MFSRLGESPASEFLCVCLCQAERGTSRVCFFFLPNWVYWKTDLFFVVAIIRSTHGLCFLYIFLFKLFKFTFVAYACFCFRLMCVVFLNVYFDLFLPPHFCLFACFLLYDKMITVILKTSLIECLCLCCKSVFYFLQNSSSLFIVCVCVCVFVSLRRSFRLFRPI